VSFHVPAKMIKLTLNSLVYAEMNLALAVIFRPDGPRFRIYDTDESDVVLALDWVIPVPKADSRGTRVVVE